METRRTYCAQSRRRRWKVGSRPETCPRTRLHPKPGETLRGFHQRLSNLGIGLRELDRRVESTEQARQQVFRLLQDKVPPLSIQALGGFVEMAEQMSQMKTIPRSWWDAGSRRELKIVIARCQEEHRSAPGASRSKLIDRFSFQAIQAKRAAELAVQAKRIPVIYSQAAARLAAPLKQQVSVWYTQRVPRTGRLVDDLAKLADYHRRVDFCRQAHWHTPAIWLRTFAGQPDWAGTARGRLDSVEEVRGN